MTKKIRHKDSLGECPLCGSTDLEYGCAEPQDELLYYPFTCNNCKEEGREWYDLVYRCSTIDGDEEDD